MKILSHHSLGEGLDTQLEQGFFLVLANSSKELPKLKRAVFALEAEEGQMIQMPLVP